MRIRLSIVSHPGHMELSKWFSELNSELDGTSDRSCVIVAASIIEHQLTECLRGRLVPTGAAQDSFLDGANAPIGTFSARIDLAHRIGMIGQQFARDLHLIRRMRNELAHSVVGRSFNDPALGDQVRHLVSSQDLKTRAPFLLTHPYDTVRGQFILCAILIVSHLDSEIQGIRPLPSVEKDILYTTTYTDGKKDKENG
jgi:DNA-binding MltR family transcriptional regulator